MPNGPTGVMARLTQVDTWIFDLDNTLYPADCDLFAQVRDRMTEFVASRLNMAAADARALQRRYYQKYGTTLRGLMNHDGVDPHEFLDYVHSIDVEGLAPAPALREGLARLPGRRLIYTNGSTRHAHNVAERLGVADLFDDVFDIVAADFVPKPDAGAFDRMLAMLNVEPGCAAFFEDIGRNLEPAAARGVTTVLVRGSDPSIAGVSEGEHIHFEIDDLAGWLNAVAGTLGASAASI